jgi:hypothetical protein
MTVSGFQRYISNSPYSAKERLQTPTYSPRQRLLNLTFLKGTNSSDISCKKNAHKTDSLYSVPICRQWHREIQLVIFPPLLFMHFPPLHAFSLVSLIHFGLTLLNLESKLNIQTVKKTWELLPHLNLKWNGSQIPTQHEIYSCCWLVIIPHPYLHIPHIAAAHSNSALVERCCQGDAEKMCWKT